MVCPLPSLPLFSFLFFSFLTVPQECVWRSSLGSLSTRLHFVLITLFKVRRRYKRDREERRKSDRVQSEESYYILFYIFTFLYFFDEIIDCGRSLRGPSFVADKTWAVSALGYSIY